MDGIQLSSLLITHDVYNRIDFSYLAEFFRFLGVFVCEDVMSDTNEKTDAELYTKYDAHIYLKEDHARSEETEADTVVEHNHNQRGKQSGIVIFAYDFLVQNQQKNVELHKEGTPGNVYGHNRFMFRSVQEEINYLGSLTKRVFDNQQALQMLTPLIKIFVEQKIWFHSMNLQYYSKKKSTIASKAKEAFLSCHNQIRELQKKDYGFFQYIYEYALTWCSLKVNTACDYNQEMLYFSVDNLVKQCSELYRKYYGFSNAKVLEGLCYALSPINAKEAIQAFEEALQDIGAVSYASPIYYWIGKRYESYHNYREEAEKNYEMANRMKKKFRNYFKLAVFKRDVQQYPEAIELFEEIIRRLKIKRELDFMDPLELEYLFKTYVQLSYIYHLEKKYVNVIETGKKAIGVYDREGGLIKRCRYFEAFYGTEAAEYREELMKRLNLKMVYSLMADGYAQLSDRENAERCLDEMKKCENR